MDYINILHHAQASINNMRLALLCQLKLDDETELKMTIKEIFKKYGKNDPKINTLLSGIPKISKIRCAHIVFTFLLGLHIYQNCNTKKIDQNTKCILKKAEHEHDFTFLWFLICLFHDLGYAEEEKGRKSRFGNAWINKTKLGEINGVPALYENNYSKYFYYRKKYCKKTDHGIFAGLTMYKDLCKIREQKAQEIKRTNLWNPSLIPLYNLASWIVLAHNIWFVKDTDIDNCKIYQKYRLEQLILKTNTNNGQNEIANYPIKLSQHPLLFLFCLVDLIEPMKRIGNLDCCKEINFSITDTKVKITSKLECDCGKKYLDDLTAANDWLVKTKRDGNTVTLFLK